VEGEYLEVDPPRLLVHTWSASWSLPLVTIVRWELEAQNEHGLHSGDPRARAGTLLRIRHEGFGGNTTVAQDHTQGWQRVLGWLQSFAEKGETIESRH
jgi:uncharacterized protein YndB with AHSA1/START domain